MPETSVKKKVSFTNTSNKAKILYFVCSQKKFEEIQAYFERDQVLREKYQVRREIVEIEEIQGSIQEVIDKKVQTVKNYMAEQGIVWKQNVHLFACEDTSLTFVGMGELPGPYIKSFLQNMTLEQLYRLAKSCGDEKEKTFDARAYSNISFYWEGDLFEKPITIEGHTDGWIVKPRGDHGFGWDAIFQPMHPNIRKTFAEMTMEEKEMFSPRRKALDKLKAFLLENDA